MIGGVINKINNRIIDHWIRLDFCLHHEQAEYHYWLIMVLGFPWAIGGAGYRIKKREVIMDTTAQVMNGINR